MQNDMTQPAQLSVTEQDYYKINSIFKLAGVSLPISYSGEPESWQLPVSEEFLEGVNAQRKRLRSRNLQIHRQSLELGSGAINSQTFSDGAHRIGILSKDWKRIVTYMRGGKQVSAFKDRVWIDYYMKKEPGEETKVSSMDVFSLPVSAGRREEYNPENVISKTKIWAVGALIISILSWFMAGMLLPIMVICLVTPSLWGAAAILLQILLWSGGIALGSTWLFRKSKLLWKWREDSRDVVAAIREREPEFCIEKLISIINSRTQRLMFADTAEEVEDFVSCNIHGFLKAHENVVNCELRNFWFTSFRLDGNYMYMDVTLRTRLERDQGRHIQRSKQTIMLQLNKAVQGIMSEDLYNDWSIARLETHEK